MNLARIENRLVVISETVGVAAYDFDFDLNFRCDHPIMFSGEELCVLRIGAIADYAAEYDDKKALGLRLVNTPEEHLRASELEYWYPIISDLTPKSHVFDALPEAREVEAEFGWPIFLKGSRQTSRHSAALSVINDPQQYKEVAALYVGDDILHWQKPVVREFARLEPVRGEVPMQVRPSMEFRTFWWSGECVAWGRYWHQVPEYHADDVQHGISLAREAAKRLTVPFLVIDIAKKVDGTWIVIECNDGQESGYAGVAAKKLWEGVMASIST